jgi:hypothetical protein
MTRWSRQGALVLPLILVNTIAVYGQAAWAHEHINPLWLVDVLFAAAVESIGVYLAVEAHAALMAGDASARLRTGSYLIGLAAGALNYWHFASAAFRPTSVAVAFGLLSAISPWLWAIRSRSLNRGRLRELGQVDPRAVRFAPLRWVLFPVRTTRAFRGAVWAGIVQPADAIALYDARRAVRGTAPAPVGPPEQVDPLCLQPLIDGPEPEPLTEVPVDPWSRAVPIEFDDLQRLAATTARATVAAMLRSGVLAVPEIEPAVEEIDEPRDEPTAPAEGTEPVPAGASEPVPAELAAGDEPAATTADLDDTSTAAQPDPVDPPQGDPEPVPATAPAKRRPPVPDKRILRRLRDEEAVPRRDDGTVPIRLVEDLFGARQERAVRLLREAGLYREGEAEAVPAVEPEPVPTEPELSTTGAQS